MTSQQAVLVVEDEGMIAMMIEDYLDVLGYAPFAIAATVDEAMAALDGGGRPAAALLDCRLGAERSWPVARLLAERGVPMLFMTGAPDEDFPADLAGTVTLAKPFTLSILEEALGKLLTRAKETDESA